MFYSVSLLSTVDLEPREVAISAVGSGPDFDTTLGGLERHILFEGRSSLKFNHCLVHGNVTARIVHFSELRG